MADKKQIAIKERILKQAMEFWGVSDIRDMDPVIDLLLEVFAHESNKLHQEIEQSDSRILHRLSRILIGNKWSLPKPAHALMTITPNHGECCELDAEDHFYAEKNIFGKGDIQVFITPLFSYKLIDAKIRAIAYNDSIRHSTDSFSTPTRFLDPKNRIADYCVWVGMDVSKEVLQKMDSIMFCIKPSDMGLLPFMNMAFFYDCTGNRLNTKTGLHVEDPYSNAHYFDEIRDFYSDLYFNVSIRDASKEKHTYREMFPGYASDCEVPDDSESLFWVKIAFPETFTKESLENLEVYLNTFPVINRQIVYKQHNFRSTGRIIPLKCPSRTLKGDNKIKAFVLSVPQKDATNAEIKYWVTSGSLANGFNERTLIQQFNIEKYDASGIMLRTCMQGGTTHDGEQELIHSLRYGLLSRERIISKEDIKSYLLHKLGKYVESVEVGNGVAISPDSKKGLIRVTEVKIKLGQFDKDEIPNLEELAHYLEKDLTERSVCNSNYKIKFV